MDLSPETRLGLCSPRRLGRAVALDEGSSLALDKGRRVSLLLEKCRRHLAVPARFQKRTSGLSGVAGSLLSEQALSVFHPPIQAPLWAGVKAWGARFDPKTRVSRRSLRRGKGTANVFVRVHRLVRRPCRFRDTVPSRPRCTQPKTHSRSSHW